MSYETFIVCDDCKKRARIRAVSFGGSEGWVEKRPEPGKPVREHLCSSCKAAQPAPGGAAEEGE